MLEHRLEAVERELMRLNKTLQELITLYVDTQTNPLLGDLPDKHGFVPTIVKQRDKRRGQKDTIQYSLHDVRDITQQATDILKYTHVHNTLQVYGVKCVADLSEADYYNYCQQLLGDIKSLED